jgi:O-methyltransferase involved in polyketide biosynthesis
VRSRYTEQRLGELAGRGLDQYVVLGAGLDTFACRSPLVGRLRGVRGRPSRHPAVET